MMRERYYCENGFYGDNNNSILKNNFKYYFENHMQSKKSQIEQDIMEFFNNLLAPKVEEYTTTFAISKDGMMQVERIQVPYSRELSHICYLSKNLYNLGNYLVRGRYFFLLKPLSLGWLKDLKKKIEERHSKYYFSSFAAFLDEFKRISAKHIQKLHKSLGRQGYHSFDSEEIMNKFGIDKNKIIPRYEKKEDLNKYYQIGVYMFYDELWQLVRYTDEYRALGGQTAQQTLKLLMNDWKAYFKSEEKKKRIPRYKPKNGEATVIFTSQYIKKRRQYISKRSGKIITEIGFPKKANIPNIRTTIPYELIRQVRIVPKRDIYVFEIIFSRKKGQALLNRNRVIGIDFGEKNLLAIANNIGDNPRILKGGVVKLANARAEYLVGHLVSQRDNLINQVVELKKQDSLRYETIIKTIEVQIKNLNRQIAPTWFKRYNRIQDHLHKLSRQVVDYCLDHSIGTIVFGYNEKWKQNLRKEKRLRKTERKKFVPIPFFKLYKMIKYKAELLGIEIIKVKEYIDEGGIKKGSSKTCCNCGNKGMRVHRGLFRCKYCGLEINADVNGAVNHAKWGKQGSFHRYSMRDLMIPPIPLQATLAMA